MKPVRLQFAAIIVCSLFSASALAAGPLELLRIRSKATCWNIARCFRPTNPYEDGVSIVTIAGTKKSTLRKWMATCAPPTIAEMQGRWRVLNRGLAAAATGHSRAVKEIWADSCSGFGDNIMIEEMAPDDWMSTWTFETDHSGSLERRGNFALTPADGESPGPQAAVIDYRKAKNPRLDPNRIVIDKIVKLNDRYMLGLAIAVVGPAKFKIGYFVLERI